MIGKGSGFYRFRYHILIKTLLMVKEIDKIEFIIPNNISYQERNKIAYKKAKEYCLSHCDTGWIPDNYFNSKNSFFTKNGQDYARCTIRRWI